MEDNTVDPGTAVHGAVKPCNALVSYAEGSEFIF